MVIGDRLDENTTSGFSLPSPGTDVVHAYLDAGRLEPRGEVRVGDDRWWLGDKADRELAAVPLADRVEQIVERGLTMSLAEYAENPLCEATS